MPKTHVMLAQEIEVLEKHLLSMDDIQANKPDVIIKTVAENEIVIREAHEDFCGYMRSFFETRIQERKKEVLEMLDPSEGKLPSKKKSE